MLDYFNAEFATAKGRVTDPSFISITNTVIKNHNRIRDRYITTAKSVPPTHLVYKILSGLQLSQSLLGDYFDYKVRDRSRRLATALNVTSPSSYGTTFTGNFLNGGSESVIFTYESFDKSVDWKQLEPITYKYHTNTNINYVTGTEQDDSAYAFISINVVMLAYQYLMWARWRFTNDVEENVYNYISKYPLFNSVKSYMDISLFNRHYYRVIGTPILDDDRVAEFPIPNISNRLDRSNLKIVNDILGKSTTIGSALFSTPAFFAETGLDLIKPVPVIQLQQTSWFLLACKLPYIHYGLTVGYMTGSSLDSKIMSSMKRELRAFLNSRTLTHVPKHMKLHIMDTYLDNLLSMAESF